MSEDLANAMLANRIAVISDNETFDAIWEDAVAGDADALLIVGTLQGMKEHLERKGMHCVECKDRLSPSEVGASLVFYSTHSPTVGGSMFCVRCSSKYHDTEDFFAAFCKVRPPMQAGHA
jgi:hypothetical protein